MRSDTMDDVTLTQSTHPDVQYVYRDGQRFGYIIRRAKTWEAHRRTGVRPIFDRRTGETTPGDWKGSRGFRSEQAAVQWVAR